MNDTGTRPVSTHERGPPSLDFGQTTHWQDICGGRQLCHYWQQPNESKITAMTELLIVLGFLALLIAAWAPSRLRALRSGHTRWDSMYNSSRDTDRTRSLHDVSYL